MGAGIYLKSGVNSKGKSSLFIKATKGKKVFKMGLGISVKPSDWSKRTSRIKGGADNAIILNREIEKAETNIKTS